MKNRINQSVLYINYAPYGNSGNILTYMRKTFNTVIYIEFIFHHLGRTQSAIYHYKNDKLVKIEPILQILMPSNFAFIALPLRSFINFLQILFHAIRLAKMYGSFDIYFSVNAFISWCGNILKKIQIVHKTIFWVWDYYPPVHKNITITLMRSIYWQFDKAAITSDRVVFVNNRLITLRQNIGILPKHHLSYPVVGIGTDANKPPIKSPNPLVFVFYGAIKKSQGLDFIFTHANEIVREFPQCSLRIIGSGPDEEYFRLKAKKSPLRCKFYGYIKDTSMVNKAIASSTLGLALYKPEADNVSYFGDPAKIKAYLSQGIPVIATDIFEFAKHLYDSNAGVVIPYDDITSFCSAVKKITSSYNHYCDNVFFLAKKYQYSIIYKTLFTLEPDTV